MSNANLLRALSPLHQAPAFGSVGFNAVQNEGGDPTYVPSAEALVRHAALQAASSTSDVVAMVPQSYRQVLRPLLEEVAKTVGKLLSAQATTAKWRQHVVAGTFPSWCANQVPAVQFGRAFEDSAEGRTFHASLEEAHTNHLKLVLNSAVRAKEDEIKQLERALSPEDLFPIFKGPILERRKMLKSTQRIPRLEQTATGDVNVLGWVENPMTDALAQQVLEDCIVYADRVKAIVSSSALASHQKKEAKKAVQASADVEMQDQAAASGPSIQSLVDRAVNAAVRRLGSSKDQGSCKYNYSGCSCLTNCAGPSTPLSPSPRRRGITGNQCACPPKGSSCRTSKEDRTARRDSRWEWKSAGTKACSRAPTRLVASPIRTTSSKEGQGGCPEGPMERCSGREKGCERRLRNQVATSDLPAEMRSLLDASLRSWDYRRGPLSLPDVIVNVPLPIAVDEIVRRTPLYIMDALRYRSSIHCGPNVNLPHEIEWDLSVGMKYLFHQPRRSEMIRLAWTDFKRRFRWRVKFLLEGENRVYDPEYDVRPPSKKDPPMLPLYIELALRRGGAYVDQSIARIPEDGLTDSLWAPLGPKVNAIRRFLIDNEYVVTATDKNLGVAVSQRSWIIEKTTQCLANPREYRPVPAPEAKRILDTKHTKMLLLSRQSEDFDYKYGSLSEFLKSKVTPPGEEHHIPHFYGIPKIHKQPVKFRPILPCHSAIQNPAAKFCSKMLKPLVAEARTVIHGSKDLATKLSSLRLHTWRNYYIVTGDVVAYYPSIPLRKCLDRVTEMYTDHLLNSEEKWMYPQERDKLMKLFMDCLEVGNTELLTQFQGTTYLQLNGLAMGVADSPDLANLYGWFCENRDKVLQEPDIAFYGRYIDDCIGIVYAPSEEEALRTMQATVHIDDCVIEWQVGKHQPFLDMQLYVDSDNRLQHMPYRKAKSLHQRVPWISAHPLDVKRGTFYGEMSRLATLSSKFEHYLDAVNWLIALYRTRGYPEELVRIWARDKLYTRWESRISPRVEDEGNVLVLKTHFNTTWDFFDVHELGSTIAGYMRTWLDKAERMEFSPEFPPEPENYGHDVQPGPTMALRTLSDAGIDLWVPDIRKTDILQRRWLVSRRRTKNLFDITGLWKKIVLEQHDEQLIQEGAIRPRVDPNPQPKGKQRMVNLDSDSSDEDGAMTWDNEGPSKRPRLLSEDVTRSSGPITRSPSPQSVEYTQPVIDAMMRIGRW